MPSLVTQRQIRAVKKLPFCHVCGRAFALDEKTTDDHVPPKSCFAGKDRNFPLQLPTHEGCNTKCNLTDEKIGQVVSLKHGGLAPPRNCRLEFSMFKGASSGATLGALVNVDVHGEIRRWIRGFHAALYHEPLPQSAKFAIQTPFPLVRLTAGGPVLEPVRPQDFKFVETIKINRTACSLDQIRCYNNKLTYECIWDQADNGQWICIFALDLYDWKHLGDIHNFPARGCVGSYFSPSQSAPALASRGTRLVASVSNAEPLDPFGS